MFKEMSSEEFKERLYYFPAIFLTGADGLVGSRCREIFSQRYAELTSTDISDLDITDSEAVIHWLEKFRPDVLINFSAMIKVREIEKERGNFDGNAWQVNALGAKNLAEACLKNNIFLIQASTDYVFPCYPPVPLNQGPFAENSSVAYSPKETNWYGWTKREGERMVQEVMGEEGKFAIVRISRPFRASFERGDFARDILKRYQEGNLYPMIVDMTISTTPIDELTRALVRMMERREIISSWPPERRIFHVVNTNLAIPATPYRYARVLIKIFTGQEPKIEGITLQEFYDAHPQMYKIPGSGLSCQRTEEDLDLNFGTWQEWIVELRSQIKQIRPALLSSF